MLRKGGKEKQVYCVQSMVNKGNHRGDKELSYNKLLRLNVFNIQATHYDGFYPIPWVLVKYLSHYRRHLKLSGQ